MAAKRKKRGLDLLTYVLVVLVLIGLIGFFAYFTNGFTSDFKEFYVEINGESVLTGSKSVEVTLEEPINVDVKYTLGALNKEVSGYSLKVVPNRENDFVFYVDGQACSFSAEEDFTNAFDIVQEETSFTINYNNIYQVLCKQYEGSEIEIDKTQIDFEKDLFTVVVTSFNGEAEITIGLKFSGNEIDGVILDMKEIVF